MKTISGRTSDVDYEEDRTSITLSRATVGRGDIDAEVSSKNGSRRHYFFNARRILVDGEAGVVCAGIDMTARKLAEMKIHEQANLLEKKRLEAQLLRTQRLEIIGQLAGGIAHDLNNILAPILMCAQTLRDEVASPEGLSMLTTIESTARRGAEIVKQITKFASGMEGKRVLLQPQDVLAEMVRIIRETFPKSIVLKTDLKDNLWAVFGDATQLHQVLLNLAVNARDAMPRGGTLGLAAEDILLDEVATRLMPGLRPGPHVLFRISDTGTGIPPEVGDKIFDPFFTTKGSDGGTGLGLSTVMGIVKSHKGFIHFESKVGEGSEFRIYLPADLTRPATVKAGGPMAPPQGGGELVLIVDDEEAVCTVTKRILESNRYRTLVAKNGTEAVALFAREAKEINFVLTDLNMPSMSGPDTIAALKKINPGVRIIAATGSDPGHGMTSAAELGVRALLKKPFDVYALLDTLQKVSGRAG